MKIDRLMSIVVYLLNHGRTSAQKLAQKFEVSPRTIMRDLDSLDQAGIPIQSFCGADGGYQIIQSLYAIGSGGIQLDCRRPEGNGKRIHE